MTDRPTELAEVQITLAKLMRRRSNGSLSVEQEVELDRSIECLVKVIRHLRSFFEIEEWQ